MPKIVGMLLLIISAISCICNQLCTKKEKVENLREMRRAILYITQEIQFSMSDVSTLCEKTAQIIKGEVSNIFNSIADILNAESNTDFYTAWKKVCGEKEFFSEKAEIVLSELFCEFGKKSLEAEVENMKRARHILEETEKEEEKKYHSDRKLICTLGVSACCAVIIVLI